jgi:hypothetical protein
MEMMVPSAAPQQADGEVQDIRDALARPRGRPKTREIPNATHSPHALFGRLSFQKPYRN